MPPNHGALVVFGSGPGVGRAVAALFAERGFAHVILLSRNAERLAQDVNVVLKAGPDTSVHQIPTDLADTEQVQKGLEKAKQALNGARLDCVLFNAARTGQSKFLDFPPESLETDLRLAVVSLYAVAQWALPQLLESAKNEGRTPSLLATSGMLAKDPFPAMFSLAACKAGQYSLMHSLHKEYESKGVHCGLIIIGGTVSDNSKVTNARNIAEETWKMYKVPQGEGKLEVVMTDPAYEEHVKNREKKL